jgi:hypothetical protein
MNSMSVKSCENGFSVSREDGKEYEIDLIRYFFRKIR